MVAMPARRLLEDEALRRRYASRFDHILVDEFQDTSRAQFELLGALSDDDFSTVTVVGDRKQSIYRWRDARVENVIEFPGEQAPLHTNYRSRQNILDIAHAFISTDDAFKGADDNLPLCAHRGANAYPVVLFHPEENEDWEAEAEALAAWVRHLTEGHAVDNLPGPPEGGFIAVQNVAVLMRSLKANHGLPHIERAFERHGIPYAVVGGANAAETRALESWHAAMSLLLPGNRARELLTVLEGAPWNVPDAVLWELVRDVKRRPGGMDLLSDDDIARVQDPRAADRLRELRAHIGDLEARMVSGDFRSFVAWAIEESPLAARLFEGLTSAAASKTVQDLVIEVMDAFDQVSLTERPAGLRAFLDHLRAAIDDRRFREESDVRLPSDRVSVMTIHQAKGLEFPAVAVAGVKPPSGKRDHHYLSREHGLYFAASDAESWKRKPPDAPDFEYERRMEEQEANCLFYVAMTRAKDYLWVSSPLCEGKTPRKNKDTVSLFTHLLDCAGDVDPLVILRRPPEVAPPAEPALGDADVRVSELVDALGDWSRARERNDVADGTPATSVAALDVVSWPELHAFHECPLRFRYRFRTRVGDVMGTDDEGHDMEREIEEAVSIPKGMTPADYGILVHGALERIFRDGTPAAGAIDVAAAKLPEGTVTRKAKDAARTLVDGVLDSDVGTPGNGIATEQPFEVRLQTLVVHGVFDRIERGPEGLRVIDYKAGVEHPAHDFQVRLYSWALGRIDDEPVDGLICYLRENGAVVRRVTTPDSAAEVEALATRLETALRSGDYPATPGDVCTACAYRTVCPSAVAPVA
jgi:superfamily I DNA/RNA helicase/CRISPR/Cas system-associated exonuclease Cas4 (RecB family)